MNELIEQIQYLDAKELEQLQRIIAERIALLAERKRLAALLNR